MKAIKMATILLCAGFVFASCEENEVAGLGEVKENVATVTFEGSQWSSLIDTVQYGGGLLYGENASTYGWTDEKTQLSGGMTNSWGGMYGFSEGGTCISNYVSINMNHNTYNYQLEVPIGNGSKNFGIVFCPASLKFADNKARVVRSMLISPTTYLLAIEKYGDGWSKKLTEQGDWLTLHITAENGKSVDVDMARDGKMIYSWKKIDLSELGAVQTLTFSMTGSDANEYGLKTPTYVALDNIEIEL